MLTNWAWSAVSRKASISLRARAACLQTCENIRPSVEPFALDHSQDTNLGCRQFHALRVGLVDLGHPSVLSPIRCPALLSDRPNLCIDEKGIGEMIG